MSDARGPIEDTFRRILADHCTKDAVDRAEREQGRLPALWDAITGSGLHLAGVPEEHGGMGGDLEDAMAVMRLSGAFAAPCPLAESWLAAMALAECSVAVAPGWGAIAIDPHATPLARRNDLEWRVTGEVRGVPYAEQTDQLVVAVLCDNSPRLLRHEGPLPEGDAGRTLPGAPCRDLIFNTHAYPRSAMLRPNSPDVFENLFRLGALCRSFQMAGALETVLRMCVEHANVRVQFGKPIAQFQAVRQQIAALAGQSAAASRAADLTLEAVMRGGGENEIAAAKARIGEAAGIAAAIAHQVHGAMGITYEHALHQYTRRLWAWRDDFGNERYWQRKLGASISVRGADNLWAFLSGT